MARFKVKVSRKGKVSIKRKPYFKKKAFRRRKLRFTTAIPERYRATLNYVQNRSMTFTPLNFNSLNTFRLNDLYDVDFTATGHQAKYRDQLYQWYQYGRCIGYAISIRIFSDSNQPMSIACGPSALSTISDHDSFLEEKRTIKRVVSANSPVIIKYRNYTDKHLGNKRGTWSSESQYLQSDGVTLNGSTSCWFHIFCQRILSSTVESNNLYFQIYIRQYAQFQQPYLLGQS